LNSWFPSLVGHVIAHRIALQKVPVVDQQRIRGLGPDRVNMRGGAGEADGVIGFVGVVVVGEHVHVQVGRLHDTEVRLLARCAGGKGVQRNQTGPGDCTGEERPACQCISLRTCHGDLLIPSWEWCAQS
jgi:hypothetical protein